MTEGPPRTRYGYKSHADRWVGLIDGVRALKSGADLSVWLDPIHVYLFDTSGVLAAPAAYAEAA
jgi:glycerol transport system ATP-binding protein